jgi:hypothetical protein
VIAELRTNRIGERTDSEFAARVLKLLHHLAFAEPTQIAARGLAGAGGVATSKVFEAGALLQLLSDLPCKVAARYEYVTGFPFHAANVETSIVRGKGSRRANGYPGRVFPSGSRRKAASRAAVFSIAPACIISYPWVFSIGMPINAACAVVPRRFAAEESEL